MSSATITQTDIDLLTGADLMDYLRTIAPTNHQELLEWPVALYLRGIYTQGEVMNCLGDTSQGNLDTEIESLKVNCARWINS